MGKFLAIVIVVSAIVAGAALYYLQVYAFYEELEATGPADVRLTVLATGEAEPVAHNSFRGIDADSSPIRYRACFETDLTLTELEDAYTPYDDAVPLEAPGWFGCFDADAVGAALEDGTAKAFLSVRDIQYGIDRIVAVTETGQGYAWHQINECGEVVFDGQPAPDNCPEPPEGY